MKQALKYGLGMGGGSLLNTELWDYYNHPERDNMFVVDALKGTLGDERKRQGILNGIIGAGGGLGLAHMGGAGGISSMLGAIGMSGAKDLIATTTPAVNRITEAAENASHATAKLAEGLNAANKQNNANAILAGILGTGALGLGAVGLTKYLTSKDKKDQARIQYKLQGKEGDPSTEATIDMPIDSPEFSNKLREGLNLGIKRQVGKTIKYNSLKRDQETGKMIPYETWHKKYNSDGTRKFGYEPSEDDSEKSASADPALKQVEAAKPDYTIKVENGKCSCEACDGHPVSISEGFKAFRAALGINDDGYEKKANTVGDLLAGLGAGAAGAAVGTSLPGDMNPLLKALLGGGTGLAIGSLASMAKSKDGVAETAQSYANLGSPMPPSQMPAGSDEEDDWDKEAAAPAPQPPPPAQPKGTNATRQLPPGSGGTILPAPQQSTDLTSVDNATNAPATLGNNVKSAGVGAAAVGALLGLGTSDKDNRISSALGGAVGGHAGIETARILGKDQAMKYTSQMERLRMLPRTQAAQRALRGVTGRLGLITAGAAGLTALAGLGGARIGRWLQGPSAGNNTTTPATPGNNFSKSAGVGSAVAGGLLGLGTSDKDNRVSSALGGAVGGHAGMEIGRMAGAPSIENQIGKMRNLVGFDLLNPFVADEKAIARANEVMADPAARKAMMKMTGKMGLISAGILGLGTASAVGGAKLGRLLQDYLSKNNTAGPVKTAAQAPAPAPAPAPPAPADPSMPPPPAGGAAPADPNMPPPPADPNMPPPPPPAPPAPPAPADPKAVAVKATSTLDRIKNALGKLKKSDTRGRSIAALGDSLKAEAETDADKTHSGSLEALAHAKAKSLIH